MSSSRSACRWARGERPRGDPDSACGTRWNTLVFQRAAFVVGSMLPESGGHSADGFLPGPMSPRRVTQACSRPTFANGG